MSGAFFLTLLFFVPVAIGLLHTLWRIDARPAPNEFTEADLISVRPENEITYALLCRLNDRKDDPNGAPAIGLSKADLDRLIEIRGLIFDPNDMLEGSLIARQYRDEILQLWQKGQKGMNVIHQLAVHDQIADFARPSFDEEVVFVPDLKWISFLVDCYVMSQPFEKQLDTIDELLQFDSVLRRFSTVAKTLIGKVAAYAIISKNLHLGAALCNLPDTSSETLNRLQTHFQPLTEPQVNLRNSMIFEYFLFKNEMMKLQDQLEGRKSRFLKLNSSLRYCQSYVNCQIQKEAGEPVPNYAPISLWPWSFPNLPKVHFSAGRVPWLYKIYNPIGSELLIILIPAHDKIGIIKTRILIQDDLLQWIIARRMGQEGSLKAKAYGDEYIVDIDKQMVFSVGPDGKAYTNDDIKMRINPEVLGLK